ncbi:uncharacterized protein [Prorops nasuta]|uniref:uncharacterized protein n=1 Tax=Prorops nasuta TaxID=863751 RepID=UPI0034CF189D
MWRFLLFLYLLPLALSSERSLNRSDLSCSGKPHYNVTLAAYSPDYDSDDESEYQDFKRKKLRTLQEFIDGRAKYVTVAMDLSALPYGSPICIPELNEHFGRRINLQARDYDWSFNKTGFSRLDICVRSVMDTYDKAVNRAVTIYV